MPGGEGNLNYNLCLSDLQQRWLMCCSHLQLSPIKNLLADISAWWKMLSADMWPKTGGNCCSFFLLWASSCQLIGGKCYSVSRGQQIGPTKVWLVGPICQPVWTRDVVLGLSMHCTRSQHQQQHRSSSYRETKALCTVLTFEIYSCDQTPSIQSGKYLEMNYNDTDQWCGLRPLVLGQDRSETNQSWYCV